MHTKICVHCHFERIRGFTRMRYTNLLTYLLCILFESKKKQKIQKKRTKASGKQCNLGYLP